MPISYQSLSSIELFDELLYAAASNNIPKGKRLVKHMYQRYPKEPDCITQIAIDSISPFQKYCVAMQFYFDKLTLESME